jgi:hypothetical protein
MMPGGLRDWLVTFVVAVARDVDIRTGSDHEAPIEAAVALHSPMLAMDWAVSDLREKIRTLMSRAPSSP